MKRYEEGGPEYCRMTWKPDDEPKPISMWAEVGPVTDGLVQTFWEVNEYGERLAVVYTMVGEPMVRKPAKLNIDTNKLERVRS